MDGGKAMRAAIAMLLVSLSVQASEPERIELAAAVRHLAERTEPERPKRARECKHEERAVVEACLRRMLFGIDLRR